MVAKILRVLHQAWQPEPVRHAVYAFTASLSLSLLGFLNDVQAAMATGDHLPSVAVLGKAAMSALVGAGTGLVSWIAQRSSTADNTDTPAPAQGS